MEAIVIGYLSGGVIFGVGGAVWSARNPGARGEPNFVRDLFLYGSLWPLLIGFGAWAALDFLGKKISEKIGV